MALRTLSLFAGGAGLDLGVELAVPDARCVCFVEREAYAAATLVARMEEGSLAPAPVWSDVRTFDGHPWRGRVDMVVGGFPCQDISVAGKGAGLAGERSGLWREYRRIVEEIAPSLVFIENVSALRSRGLDVVLADLAALGFDAEWGCFRASDVGAPHRRERIFILAYRRGVELRHEPWWCSGSRRPGAPVAGDAGPDVADGDGDGCEGVGRVLRAEHDAHGRGCGPALGDTDIARLEGRGEPEPSDADEWTPWPPGPEELDQWRRYLRLRPDAEPSVCRGAHGLAGGLEYRTARLRLLGNGVVPQVAALAFVDLYRRALT